MNPKPRILMLASNTPQAAGSGAPVRTYHFAKALAAFGDLSLAIFGEDAEGEMAADLRASCRRLIRARSDSRSAGNGRAGSPLYHWIKAAGVVAAPWRNEWNGLLSYSLALCTSEGSSLAVPASRRLLAALLQAELSAAARLWKVAPMVTFCQRESFLAIRPDLTALLAREQVDIVWFEHSFNFPFVETLLRERKRPLLVCNAHNMEFDVARRLTGMPGSGRSPGWWRTQARLLRKVEARAFRTADLVVACSEADKSRALELAPQANVAVVANGVDGTYFRPSPGRMRAPVPTLLFTGTFEYGPNRDAVEYFLAEIFARIRQSVPNCRFVFAGHHAQDAFKALGIRDAAVACVSDPPDIRPEFERAWAFVVPLRVGGGTRLKIIEAMSMHCAVVSTSMGAEGVPYVDGRHLLLADTPERFADAVVRVLTDMELRARLETQAVEWVRERYDWRHVCAQAIEALRGLSARSMQVGPMSKRVDVDPLKTSRTSVRS
jgi:glycosyltransferase involved in cell wall biosynthesis